MTWCCCSWKNYHASVGPFQGPEIFSKCRLEYMDNKRFLNVLHIKPIYASTNGLPNISPTQEISKISDDIGTKVSVSNEPPLVHTFTNEESDSEVDTANQTVVVKVDLERPHTSETMNSRLSLPPLSIASSSPAAVENLARRQLKKLKSLLPKRQVPSTEKTEGGASEEPVTRPKRLSVFSLARKKLKPKENLDIISAEPEPEPEPVIISSPRTMPLISHPMLRTKSTVSRINMKPMDTTQFAMFFIHGVGGNLKIWQQQITYFNDKGFEMIAIDLIGHGCSSMPRKKKDYNFDSIKNDIITIFDKYSKQHNIIVAHSYGTCFAAVLSRERSSKVSHLVFLSSGAPVPLEPEDGAFGLPSPILAMFRPVLNETFRKLAFCKTPSPETFRRAFGVRTSALKNIMLGQHWPLGNIAYHQQIVAPTLLIFGNLDGLVSLDEMNQMRKAVTDSHLEVIDQASHMVMQEAGHLVNNLIEKFLNLCPLSESNNLLKEDISSSMTYGRAKSPGAISRSLPPSKAFRLKSARRR